MSYKMSKADNILRNSRLASMGVTQNELEKPLVLILCEQECENEAEYIKHGVLLGDGAATVLVMPSLCDMAAEGAGKNSLLFAREAVCDLAESLLSIYPVGAVGIVAASETAAAGMIMAAVRRNIPLAFLPAFLHGDYRPSVVLRTRALIDCGKASIGELDGLEGQISSGRSVEMDNLNSLCVFLEGCGMSVMGAVGAASVTEKINCARATGQIAVTRASELSYPRMNLDKDSIAAGLAVFIAAGGTSAALLHILAIAAENQLDFDLKDAEALSKKLPQLAMVAPFGEADIKRFAKDGGVLAILKQLAGIPKLLSPTLKIGGKTVSSLLSEGGFAGEVISSPDSPCCDGGFEIIKGNLFDYGIFRRNVKEKAFKGAAAVFDSEDQFKAAVSGKSIKAGSVVVVRGQSATDKGMPLLDVQSYLAAAGLSDIVVVTDGRVLETESADSGAPVISLCTGGVMAAIKTGDPIEIDFKKCKLNHGVAGKEINQRLKKLNHEESLSGGLFRYSHLCGEPENGCVLRKKF